MNKYKKISRGLLAGFKKKYPSDITSYDLLKAFAVVTMIIDHVGMYFFPDQIIWRVIGRASFPIWLFLVGYARTRDISANLVFGASLLVIINMIYGMSIFPLNILFSIILARFVLDRLTWITNKVFFALVSAIFVFSIWAMTTRPYLEYGTQCFVFALMGYYVRANQCNNQKGMSEAALFTLLMLCASLYIVIQQLTFGFSAYENTILFSFAGLVLGVCLVLLKFEPMVFPKLTRMLPQPFVFIVQLCGRHALSVYIGHLILFKTVVFFMMPEKYNWFEFSLFFKQ